LSLGLSRHAEPGAAPTGPAAVGSAGERLGSRPGG
jgi:hypothetical protein